MADYQEEDLFDDLYDEEPASKPTPAAAAPPKAEPEVKAEPQNALPQEAPQDAAPSWQEPAAGGVDTNMDGSAFNNEGNQSYDNDQNNNDDYGPINVKEDGKMFIGGLNWETTEDSLKNYFTQFGEVSECTVMRDSATGRSRGFGFLTFRDPKCVNTVMVKEHYLDGKIIDPKRAIPREEQERTSKIFVGGVSQEATEEDFTNFFKQFGRVVDATLMMDKETGRPRGFGFVTFDGDAAVDATLKQPLQILGKPIEVKRAQPRGNMRDGEDDKKFGRNNKFGNRDGGNGNGGYDNQNNQQQQGGNAGMTPAMMAQYWQRMQQYFQQMQQQLAAGGGMPGGMGGMGGMNPMQMQQMQQMQNMQNMMGGGMNRGTGSPNPMQMQQMQQMQQQQMMQQGGGFNGGNEQAFEQQKYEQQQARRQQQSGGYGGQGGPTSWEGMYDDAPQPSIPSGPGGGRGGFKHQNNNRQRQGSSQPPTGPSAAPINAPTGPKNAGKPGANYRGGGRTNNFRHQPYGGGRG